MATTLPYVENGRIEVPHTTGRLDFPRVKSTRHLPSPRSAGAITGATSTGGGRVVLEVVVVSPGRVDAVVVLAGTDVVTGTVVGGAVVGAEVSGTVSGNSARASDDAGAAAGGSFR
ncbi:MAG: hypothetical protein ACKOQ7_08390, partial [Actinomycetota bacterium]